MPVYKSIIYYQMVKLNDTVGIFALPWCSGVPSSIPNSPSLSDKTLFFTSEKPKKYHAWSCQNVCDALTFLLDNIFIRFGTKLYRQVVLIPIGTNCAPPVADLFLFCYERDFMMSLSDDNQADVIDAFNTTSRYLDDFETLIMFILTIW